MILTLIGGISFACEGDHSEGRATFRFGQECADVRLAICILSYFLL
jgi:hypothetical protein